MLGLSLSSLQGDGTLPLWRWGTSNFAAERIRWRYRRTCTGPTTEPLAGGVRGWCRAPLLLFSDLLTEVSLVAEFANLMDLRLEPIDMSLLVFQEPLEQLA